MTPARGTHRRPALCRRASAALLAAVLVGSAGRAAAGVSTPTTTTTYQYNADGAPTAVTTQDGTGPAIKTYLTWDNFTPDANAPSTGTVSAANGNLLGIGANPDSTESSSRFAYDARDRLTACGVGSQPLASYAYHPAGPMASSTLASGDALQFYWDTGVTPLMVNTVQPSTGMTASFLGPVRYLNDGTEQVLLLPRKDTAGVYDADAQTVAAYSYEPYGAPQSDGHLEARTPEYRSRTRTRTRNLDRSSTSTCTGYDLTRNPFQYAGEYRDPLCDAYYLRARWYLPATQTFLSRDRGNPIHRYSYTAGNPVGRVDPSGLRGVEAGARAFLHALDADRNGPGGAAARIFLGPMLGIAQIFANPSGYWHRIEHDADGMDIFLAAGIAVEVGTSGIGPLPDLPGSYLQNFAARHLIDSVLGAGQSFASGFHGRRYDWAGVGQGLEYTAGGMLEGRELLGFGYKPFGMTAADVARESAVHFAAAEHDLDVLVYRVRSPLVRIGPFLGRGPWEPQFTSPLLELAHLGFYHETLVGVLHQYDEAAQDVIVRSYEVSAEPLRIDDQLTHQRLITNRAGVGIRDDQHAVFAGRYTGGADNFYGALNRQNRANDFQPSWKIMVQRRQAGTVPPDPYRVLGNNCQSFVARIRTNLGF